MRSGRDNSKRVKVFQQELAKIRREIDDGEKKRKEIETKKSAKKIDYSQLSYSELRAIAKESGIDYYWRKKKQQLIEELTNSNR